MKESYGEAPRFHKASLALISIVDGIIDEYKGAGYLLTIRQLYYQLVARGHIENSVRSYDNIVALLTNARLAGLIDWDAIEDPTRGFLEQNHWVSGSQLLHAVASHYNEDLWDGQETRIFCVIEKEALAGELGRTCKEFDVPLLPARGYPSATMLREFARTRIMRACQRIVILHLGDHDPSGMDMTRDLKERLSLFSRHQVNIDFRRIALNMGQIEEQSLPPNPAKVTDSRYTEYQRQYGGESWELDALSPPYLHDLVSSHVNKYIDHTVWNAKREKIAGIQARLQKLADNFDNGESP
jgi:hypothetical protein